MAKNPEWVFNLGTYSKKKRGSQPGLDLTRATLDVLQNKSLVNSDNCCDYYPTAPIVICADHTSPTETEMQDVPNYSLFISKESVGSTASLCLKVTGAVFAIISPA